MSILKTRPVSDPGAQLNFEAIEDALHVGNGSPEGVVAAPPGALYQDRQGGGIYRKASGTAKTGWVDISAGGAGPAATFSDDFSTDRLATDYTSWGASLPTIGGGVATVPNVSGTGLTVKSFDARCGDVKVQAKINGGTAPGNMGAVLRYVDSNNFLLASWGGGNLSLYRYEAGVFTLITSTAFTPSNNTNYWFVGVVHGNNLRGEIWTAAPAIGANPTALQETALSGNNAARFGAGRMGGAGLRVVNGNGTQTIDDLVVTAL